jgi:hypothetical protein
LAVGRLKNNNIKCKEKYLMKKNMHYGYEKLNSVIYRLLTSERMIYAIKRVDEYN